MEWGLPLLPVHLPGSLRGESLGAEPGLRGTRSALARREPAGQRCQVPVGSSPARCRRREHPRGSAWEGGLHAARVEMGKLGPDREGLAQIARPGMVCSVGRVS